MVYNGGAKISILRGGGTFKMNGQVFQYHLEISDHKQCTTTFLQISQYVYKNDHSSDTHFGVCKLKFPEVPNPVKLDDKTDDFDLDIFTDDSKEYSKRRNALQSNIEQLYFVIWDQCSFAIQENILNLTSFNITQDNQDFVPLLINIKSISVKYEDHINIYIALYNAKSKLYGYRQLPHQNKSDYFNTFSVII